MQLKLVSFVFWILFLPVCDRRESNFATLEICTGKFLRRIKSQSSFDDLETSRTHLMENFSTKIKIKYFFFNLKQHTLYSLRFGDGLDAYEQLFNWYYRKKIVAYVTQVSWSVSMNVTLSLSSVVQFSLCAPFALSRAIAVNRVKEGGQRKNNRDRHADWRERKKCIAAEAAKAATAAAAAPKKENGPMNTCHWHCYVPNTIISLRVLWAILICRRPWHTNNSVCLTLARSMLCAFERLYKISRQLFADVDQKKNNNNNQLKLDFFLRFLFVADFDERLIYCVRSTSAFRMEWSHFNVIHLLEFDFWTKIEKKSF